MAIRSNLLPSWKCLLIAGLVDFILETHRNPVELGSFAEAVS